MNSESPNSVSDDKGKDKVQNYYQEFAPFLTLGFQLAAAVILFLLIGHWIDNRYNITPIGKLVGVLVGSIGGFVNFFKTVASFNKDEKK
jgi:F0F1-type ATP synthase assembly protein I